MTQTYGELPSQQSSVANCLRQTLGTFEGSIQLAEDHIPDDLRTFSALLHPLLRLTSSSFISAFSQKLDAPLAILHRKAEGAQKDNRPAIPSFLAASAASSSRALEKLKGLEVHVRELFNIWPDSVTARFRLSSFEWFRDTTGARHEYLIFNLKPNESTDRDQSKDLWLRLERRPREEVARKRDALTRLVGRFEALDIATISHHKAGVLHRDNMEDELQASVSFDGHLSLAYLVKLLKIIHDESREYHLAGANCWFFASTIAEVTAKRARGNWKRGSLEDCDHQKSKNWVNSKQYNQIMDRVNRLSFFPFGGAV